MEKVNDTDLGGLINSGLVNVYVPLFAFVAFSGILAYWYASTMLVTNYTSFITVATLFIATCIGWIWWSLKIVKWKIWAFSQICVNEGNDLYLKAIASGLIWPTGSVFNKTEIWTQKDKIKWLKIDPEIRKIFSNIL